MQTGDPGAGEAVLFRAGDIDEHAAASLVAAARLTGKAVLVQSVFDTIKLTSDGFVQETLDRDELRWPLAWACRRELAPPSDPPSADWFIGAAILEPEA